MLPTRDGIHQVKRHFDKAKSPLDRLLETGILEPGQSGSLKLLRQDSNPRSLRNELYKQRDALFDLPPALASQSDDVRQTLKTKNLPEGKNQNTFR